MQNDTKSDRTITTSFTFSRSIVVVVVFFYLSVNVVAKAGLDKWPCWRSVFSDHQSEACINTYKKKNKAGGGRGHINVRTNLCGANLKNFLENSREAVSIFNDL